MEIQSTDQRKFGKEPLIESVVSSVTERIASTVEMSENRNIANVENSDKAVKNATNRSVKKNVDSILPHLKPKLLGNMNLERKTTTFQCFIE